MRKVLTDLVLQHLPPSKEIVWDANFPGFGVRKGKRTTTFVTQLGKDRKLTTLGHYPTLTLRGARSLASAQTAQTSTSTRKQLLVAYRAFQRHIDGTVKPTTQAQYIRYLDRLPLGGDLTNEVIATYLAQWDGKPYSQNYAYAALRIFINFCVAHGFLDKNPIYRRKPPQKTRSRDRVLTDEEIARVWNSTGQDTYGHIVRLLILTAQRREEVRRLKPEDVTDVLTFHTKGSKVNILPITPMIQKELALPFTFNNWSNSKRDLDQICGVSFRHHDLRRTAASWLARHYPPHLVRRLLGHAIDKVEETYIRYRYLPELTEMLLTWEAHITKITTPRGINPEPPVAPSQGVTGENPKQAGTTS